jgi:hypothetical protein
MIGATVVEAKRLSPLQRAWAPSFVSAYAPMHFGEAEIVMPEPGPPGLGRQSA